MAWIPKNKKSGVHYPEISDQEKAAWEADPMIGPRYEFIPVAKPEKKAPEPKAPEPVEAKRAKEETNPTPE